MENCGAIVRRGVSEREKLGIDVCSVKERDRVEFKFEVEWH